MANALTKIKTGAIADDAVTGAKIADDTVAEANMANDAISLTELKAGTDGQIITYDASGNPTAVGPGSDGQVLTSTGAGSPPAFETPAAGGIPTTGGTFTGDVIFDNQSNAGRDITWDESDDSLEFGDNTKATFGAGTDIAIYHDGSVNRFLLDGETYFNNKANSEVMIKTQTNGGVEIYNDNVKVFNTASSGVDITLTSTDTSGPPDKALLCYNGNDGANTMAGIRFVATSTGSNDHYIYGKKHASGNGQDLIIAQDSNERARFIESGGITFNGDTAAANALDDYEEGTWTITGSNSITFAGDYNTGHYIKIGKLVHCHGMLQVLDGNSNSHFGFHVPFATGNLTDSAERSTCMCGTHNWNLPGTEGNVYGTLSSSTTQVNFFMSRDNSSRLDLLAYGSAFMDFSITYTVA